MVGHLFKGLRAAALLSITIFPLAGGCNHPRSTPESATAASRGATEARNQVSSALIGKQITIRGKFSLWGKPFPYILLDNQQEVFLVPHDGSFTFGGRYSEMDAKLVTATGILRFHKDPPNLPQHIQQSGDYFYFDVETVEVRVPSDEGAAR